MKKVIFVAGTSYSGSTLLDMVLSNDKNGFSCGEVCALFYPSLEHHYKPFCGCGKPDCTIWPDIKKKSVDNLYTAIFEMMPEVDFIVDSSKNIFWINEQMDNLARKGIEPHCILIWKTPVELAHSYHKRKKIDKFSSVWIQYHRLLASVIDHWLSVEYCNFVKEKDTLKAVCEKVGIPYFDDKIHYWEKRHHTLFGNWSSKISLYDEKSDAFQKGRGILKKSNFNENSNVKSIYYENDVSNEVLSFVQQTIEKNELINSLEKLILSKNVTGPIPNEDHDLDSGILYSKQQVALKQLIRKYGILKSQIKRIFAA